MLGIGYRPGTLEHRPRTTVARYSQFGYLYEYLSICFQKAPSIPMIKLQAVIPIQSLVLLLFNALLQASQSVTVTLRDGSQIKGGFAGGGADEIKVLVAGQTLTLKTATIETIKFDPEPTGAATQGFPPAIAPSTVPASSVPSGATIPGNTAVAVRLIDAADSTHDAVGKVYRASLDEPIVSPTGQVIVPRSADTSLVLTERKQSGHLTGKAELTLSLRSITIQGKQFDVASSDVVETSSSRSARSGKTIGGLAAAGAVIGALAGGGKGAAIGAGSGATLGTVGQVLTSGQRVRVPSETRLTFRLQEPLLIQ